MGLHPVRQSSRCNVGCALLHVSRCYTCPQHHSSGQCTDPAQHGRWLQSMLKLHEWEVLSLLILQLSLISLLLLVLAVKSQSLLPHCMLYKLHSSPSKFLWLKYSHPLIWPCSPNPITSSLSICTSSLSSLSALSHLSKASLLATSQLSFPLHDVSVDRAFCMPVTL